jgi:L-fucose isomerase-like protein
MNRPVLGVIVGNRDFFPDRLVGEGRTEILSVLESMGIDVVILGENDSKLGATETWAEAQKGADLFRANRDRIDGVLVTLPNFGDEKGVVDTLRLADLRVPILVQATPDNIEKLNIERRRDSFCGKISVCNNLYQHGMPFSLTTSHVVKPDSAEFRADLAQFISVCRVVKGIKNARLGLVGARPDAFRTVRFSEKLLQAAGVTVVTVDLSDIYAVTTKLADNDKRVKERVAALTSYADVSLVPEHPINQMGKLAVALDDWMAENSLNATALQCWSSLQNNFGANACSVMSMMSQNMLPSACETDITGTLAMYALQLASGRPSALVDWNNNYGDNPDKCVFFHCGNWAKDFVGEAKMAYADVLATTLGKEHTYGALTAQAVPNPLTYARISTDDSMGEIRAIVGEGRVTPDKVDSFGMTAVVEVPRLQDLLKYICRNGFEHHVAMTPALVGDALAEALETYMGWDVYRHE